MAATATHGHEVWEAVPGYMGRWWSPDQLDDLEERFKVMHVRGPVEATFGIPVCLYDGGGWPCAGERWRRARKRARRPPYARIRLTLRTLAAAAVGLVASMPAATASATADDPRRERPAVSEVRLLEVDDDFVAKRIRAQAELREHRAALRICWCRAGREPGGQR